MLEVVRRLATELKPQAPPPAATLDSTLNADLAIDKVLVAAQTPRDLLAAVQAASARRRRRRSEALRSCIVMPSTAGGAHAAEKHIVIARPLLAVIAAVLTLAGNPPASVMAEAVTETVLRAHVRELAGEIGERNVWRSRALRAGADYIRRQWEAQGYQVVAHEYPFEGENWANLEVVRPGQRAPNEIVVIGAHYDSVLGSPGANDNGSGVAALLELARAFATRQTDRTVRFVAFVNEEPPFFKSGDMGSQHYARAARAANEDIRAMLSLETMGYYSDAPGSQKYPPLFSFFFPDRGNFLGMVSNFGSRALLRRAVAAFRSASDFPLEYVSTFGWVPGVDWSDHGSFWDEGFPAIMVTDTALYRYPHYHSARDTPEKLDYARLAKVTNALAAVVEALATVD